MFANPELGEYPLELSDETYVLAFEIDVLCALEARMGMSVNAMGREMQGDPRLSLLRAMLCAGLRTRHPKISEGEAGQVLKKALRELGGPAFGEKLAAAYFHVFNSGETEDEGPKDPPRPGVKAGTGKSSTASGSTSRNNRQPTSGGRRRRSSSAPSEQA
jgi:hypothetical protein